MRYCLLGRKEHPWLALTLGLDLTLDLGPVTLVALSPRFCEPQAEAGSRP
jgi:hypothetical protein